MTKLLLVRHGQSEWNAVGKWQGKADPPLTKLGREQASLAALELPDFNILACSNLQRAQLTAEIFAESIGWDKNKIITEPRIQERDAGGFRRLTRNEIDKKFHGFLENNKWPDEWESDQNLLSRLLEGLTAIISTSEKNDQIVVVTHGGCIYALESLCGEPYKRISNLGGRWFDIEGEKIHLGDRVHLLTEAEETFPDQI